MIVLLIHDYELALRVESYLTQNGYRWSKDKTNFLLSLHDYPDKHKMLMYVDQTKKQLYWLPCDRSLEYVKTTFGADPERGDQYYQPKDFSEIGDILNAHG